MRHLGNPPPYDAGLPQGSHIGPPIVLDPSQPVPPVVTSVIIGQPMGTKPTVTACKTCNYDIVTRIEKKPTTKTHVFAFLLCLFFCWPCVCIPYCVASCNNIDHYCPQCDTYIGSYHNYIL